jgi:glycosyltransferase involved in cell wall biosynthesis
VHLCVVTPYPPVISGIGQYGWNLTQGLARCPGIDRITVLAPEDAGEPWPHEPRIEVRRVWRRDRLLDVAMLARTVRQVKADVAWFNLGLTAYSTSHVGNFAALATPLEARLLGIPTVVTLHEVFEAAPHLHFPGWHGRMVSFGAQTATRLALEADAVCVTLDHFARVLRKRHHARNVVHIPHGTFTAPEYLERAAGAPPRDILMFGTFAPFKGLRLLLKAFRLVHADDASTTLTVAGSNHPRYPGYLAQLEREFAEAPGIRWLGQQPEEALRGLFAETSVVAVPYLATTGASSVIYRAASWGRPAVVADLPDFRSLSEEDGLRVDYVPRANARALATALRALLDDPARRHEIACHNLAALEPLTLERTCERYMRVFERVAGDR